LTEPSDPTEPDAPRRRRRPRINAESRFEERVKPLELFFDLVFVLAFTQCTGLMADMPTWEGLGRAMLVLGVLWWAWVGYAWLTSVIDPEEGAVRIVMFGATAGLLVAGVCAPQAFGDQALPFAIAYGLVRVAHIVLFLIAARDDPNLHRSVLGLAISTALGVGLLLGAAFTDGGVQYALWIAALVADFGGPALVGADGWTLVPVHFAERHGLVIILALGESIVALGAGADVELSAEVYVAAVLGVALAAAIWWTYFDVVSLVTAQRLAQTPAGRQRNELARDSYSYLHFPMVAGIVLAAFGLEESLPHLDEHLHLVPRSQCSRAWRSTCSRTWSCACATRTRSARRGSASPPCCSRCGRWRRR
jgi:low temperature requirement protein LtrA